MSSYPDKTFWAEWFQGDEFPIDSMLKGDFGPVMEWKGRHEPDVIIPMFDKVSSCQINIESEVFENLGQGQITSKLVQGSRVNS